jgi:hypothetical protein
MFFFFSRAYRCRDAKQQYGRMQFNHTAFTLLSPLTYFPSFTYLASSPSTPRPPLPAGSICYCMFSLFLSPPQFFADIHSLSLSLSPSLSRLAFASCLHYAMEDNRNSRKGTCDFVIRAKPRAEPHHCDERRTYLISRRTLILPPLREENARSVRYRRSAPPAR